MADKVKILVVGLGNMGASHASAYHRMDGYEIVGLMSRTIKSKTIPEALRGYPLFEDFDQALAETKPDAVSINTYPNTHAEYAIKAMEAGCHVFMEKPIATNIEDAEKVVAMARAKNKQAGPGLHPARAPLLDEVHRGRQDPRQASGDAPQPQPADQRAGLAMAQEPDRQPDPDRRLRRALCRRDVPADRRQAGARARHRRQAWAEAAQQNYGHLHVTFDDGSVGWYEAGWGPMMSEIAYFVKDVVGPKGCVSIVAGQGDKDEAEAGELSDSADIDQHTKTNALEGPPRRGRRRQALRQEGRDLSMADEPDHQELCDREQAFFLQGDPRGLGSLRSPWMLRSTACASFSPLNRASRKSARSASERVGPTASNRAVAFELYIGTRSPPLRAIAEKLGENAAMGGGAAALLHIGRKTATRSSARSTWTIPRFAPTCQNWRGPLTKRLSEDRHSSLARRSYIRLRLCLELNALFPALMSQDALLLPVDERDWIGRLLLELCEFCRIIDELAPSLAMMLGLQGLFFRKINEFAAAREVYNEAREIYSRLAADVNLPERYRRRILSNWATFIAPPWISPQHRKRMKRCL